MTVIPATASAASFRAVDFLSKARFGASPLGRDSIRRECAELLRLGSSLGRAVPAARAGLATWRLTLSALAETDLTPWEAEAELDRLAFALRRICLHAAHAAADHTLRSPRARDVVVAPDGSEIDCGYERSLEPAGLEARLAAYAPAPDGWQADHLLFSSGQAALNALLLALSPRAASPGNPPRIRHLGGYFETEELIAMLASHGMARELAKASADSADVLIIEPVYFDRAACAHRVDIAAALRAHCRSTQGCPSLVIVDATLIGPCFDLEAALPEELLTAEPAPLIVRLSSGLKLDQGGLELANVGLVSLYRRSDTAAAIDPAEKLKKARTLTGAGLGFDAAGALEAPWFLDRAAARGYARAVLDNNALLAQRLAEVDGLFAQVSHPSLGVHDDGTGGAPYCLVQLADDRPENYQALEQLIAREAKARNLRFDKGGSFGFRGHRYEAILPEAGEITPFFRIALGARGGWSRDGIIEMLCEVAQRKSVAGV